MAAFSFSRVNNTIIQKGRFGECVDTDGMVAVL